MICEWQCHTPGVWAHQCINDVRVQNAVFVSGGLGQGEKSVERIVRGWARAAIVPIVEDGLITCGFLDYGWTGNRADLFPRPPGPADVGLLSITNDIAEPLVRVFAGFAQPQGHVPLIAHIHPGLERGSRRLVPVLMETDHELVIPWRQNSIVIAGQAVV